MGTFGETAQTRVGAAQRMERDGTHRGDAEFLETKLKRQVCKGLIKLAKARAAIRLFKNTQG
jgi:hypothetical protein